MMTLLELSQKGVRVIRAMLFACDVPGRRVVMQRRIWPSWERSTFGGGDEATYVFSGIEGRIPLASPLGVALCCEELFREVTGVTVPAASWLLTGMQELPPRVHSPIPLPPEHPMPMCVFAAACDPPTLVDTVQPLKGDIVRPLHIDRLLGGVGQSLLDPLPPLLAEAFQAVGG
jgi:hypothetical protein